MLAQTNRDQLEGRRKETQEAVAALHKQHAKSLENVHQLTSKVKELESLGKNRQSKLEEVQTALDKKTAQLAEVKQGLSVNKLRTQENKRGKKLAETVQALMRHFPGVKGRLVDVVRLLVVMCLKLILMPTTRSARPRKGMLWPWTRV